MADFWAIYGLFAKLLMYFGVLLSCGTVLFRMVFREAEWGALTSIRPTIVWAGLVGIVASFLHFKARAGGISGELSGDFTAIVDPEILGLLWQTPDATAFLFRSIGLALVISSLLFPRGGRFLALFGVALALWSFGETGHALQFEKPWLGMLLAIHLGAVSFWIGVLGPLWRLAKYRENLPEAAALAHRFGQMAGLVVPVLLVAGAVFAFYLTGSLAVLFGTSYGIALLVKLAIVGIFLTVAAWNKFRLVPAMENGDMAAAKRLRASIVVEWMALFVILLITSGLTNGLASAH